jgi:hypothetical protein
MRRPDRAVDRRSAALPRRGSAALMEIISPIRTRGRELAEKFCVIVIRDQLPSLIRPPFFLTHKITIARDSDSQQGKLWFARRGVQISAVIPGLSRH